MVPVCVGHITQVDIHPRTHLTRVNDLSVLGNETVVTESLKGLSVTSPFPADLIVIS